MFGKCLSCVEDEFHTSANKKRLTPTLEFPCLHQNCGPRATCTNTALGRKCRCDEGYHIKSDENENGYLKYEDMFIRAKDVSTKYWDPRDDCTCMLE